MKHCDWLRLKREGENICAALRQQGYQCRQHTRRLSWKVQHLGHTYILTWLPAPLSDWNLLPNDTSPVRQQMWALVQSVLAPKQEQVMTRQRVQQKEDFSRPWAIFVNRQDAEDHVRFLHRFMPAADFEVVFDVPDSLQGLATDGKSR
jgi:hypothetical protein